MGLRVELLTSLATIIPSLQDSYKMPSYAFCDNSVLMGFIYFADKWNLFHLLREYTAWAAY